MTDTSLSRRRFIQGSAAGAGLAAAPWLSAQQSAPAAAVNAEPQTAVPITLTINGQMTELAVDVRTSLADALREQLGLTGTKVGCNHGQCGACSVLINGQRRLACLSLAVQLNGSEVTTVEGLAGLAEREGIATDDGLHPVQQAFIDRDAFQCGYCTPGQLISAVACINEGHAASAAEAREYLSGNLCRCAAYPNITAAVLDARDALGVEQKGGGARQDYHLGLLEAPNEG